MTERECMTHTEVGDHVFVRDIRCQVQIGETEAERASFQPCLVQLDVQCDLQPAGKSDQLADTINYVWLYQVVDQVARTRVFNLLEAFGEAISAEILQDQRAVTVTVRAEKLAPPVQAEVGSFGIAMTRSRR